MIHEAHNSLPGSAGLESAGEVQVKEVAFRVVEADLEWVRRVMLQMRGPLVQETLLKKITFDVWQG